MTSTLLKNAKIVNEGTIAEADVLIRGDRIERIEPELGAAGAELIDLRGRWLLPGVIDDQVHFRDPGFPEKATIASESRAAVAGGVTSFLDMPNTRPPTTTRAALIEKKRVAAETSVANYGFYLGATNANLDEVCRATREEACGIKVFMGASTGNMLVDDPDTLAGIFAGASLPVVTHCEDSPTIWAAERKARARYGDDVPMSAHPVIRSAEACYKSSSLAVELARQHGTRLHVLHLTTERELELFERGPVDNKRITVEVCVHHLWFDESDYATLGTRIKCNPSIKSRADRDALLAAVQHDLIDIVATDHAPHTREEKARRYFDAPAGLPLVQHMLLTLLEHEAAGRLDLLKIVEKTAHNPARLFGIESRGFIREGYFADLAVIDRHTPTVVTPQQILYRCGWSPFEGTTFGSSIWMTLVNGKIVWRDGRSSDNAVGQALRFSG
jgi:dihydroorotase